MSRTTDLTIVQGTDVKIKVLVQDENGNAKDVTNKSFDGGLKKRYTDPANTEIGFAFTVLDAAGGVVQLSLTNSQTSGLDSTIRYVYDVVMYEQSGETISEVQRILDGKVIISPSVTIVGS